MAHSQSLSKDYQPSFGNFQHPRIVNQAETDSFQRNLILEFILQTNLANQALCENIQFLFLNCISCLFKMKFVRKICKGDYEYSMVLIKLCYLWVLLLPISFMSVILLSKIRLNILSYGDYRISINIRPDQILSRLSLMCSLFLVVFI